MSSCKAESDRTVYGDVCSKKINTDWISSEYNMLSKKAVCKKVQCLGSPYDCCTTGSDKKNSCNNAYLNLTSECNPHMISYCNQDRLFTNKRCITWSKQNPTASAQHTKNVCGDPSSLNTTGKLSAACVKWCVDHPGQCDASMAKHCAGDYTSPECACINNKTQDSLPLYLPECYDKGCKSTGYMTNSMKNLVSSGKCPSVMKCSAGVTIDKGAVNNVLDNVVIEQNCIVEDSYEKVNTTTTTATNTGGTNVINTNTTAKPLTDVNIQKPVNNPNESPYADVNITNDKNITILQNNNIFWIFVFIFIIMTIAALGFAYYKLQPSVNNKNLV